jgi:DNA-binding transcriptional regulator YbjK
MFTSTKHENLKNEQRRLRERIESLEEEESRLAATLTEDKKRQVALEDRIKKEVDIYTEAVENATSASADEKNVESRGHLLII